MKKINYLYILYIIGYSYFYSSNLFADDTSTTNNNKAIESNKILYPLPYESNNILLISGVDYSSGFYGLKRKTEMLYMPIQFKYRKNNWNYSLTLSYISLTGPGGIFGSGGGGLIPTKPDSPHLESASNSSMQTMSENNLHSANMPTPIKTNQGLGDSLFNVNYALDMYFQLPFILELTGQVKIPTADKAKELGTGEFDWSVSLDLAYQIQSYFPFMSLGYKLMGDPKEINLNNVFFSSVGVDYALATNLNSGIIYDYQEKILDNSYDVSESTLYLNWSIKKELSLNSYYIRGFSFGSPDWATGVQFSYRF